MRKYLPLKSKVRTVENLFKKNLEKNFKWQNLLVLLNVFCEDYTFSMH